MEKLSVVLITKNEEKNLRRCLESVKDIADEIVIADSFSTDATAAIAAEFGCRFLTQEWLGYAEQKNFANARTSYNLIFSIDADEAVSPELRNSILELKRHHQTGTVYEMNRLMNYCGKWIRHCGWYPDRKPRVFEKTTSYWHGNSVHETLFIPQNAKRIILKGDLYHYSYYTVEEHLQRAEKYAKLSAEIACQKGKKTNVVAMCLRTGWRFIRDYVFRLGFLDGRLGIVVCRMNAYTIYLKYKYLLEFCHKKS